MTVTDTAIGAIRCGECDGEMHPADARGEQGAGLYTVECDHCGSIGGVNVETLDTYGAVDRLEVIRRDDDE